ncbi:Metallo-hydrolase/oxidoreductase, partial [Microthyrium microscopicum]
LAQLSFPLGWYSSKPKHPEKIRQVKTIKPDWGTASLNSPISKTRADCIIATWLGHAGALVEFPSLSPSESSPETSKDNESIYCLFDPIFSERAGPTQYTGPSRLKKSPCEVPDLPGCHAVYISHNHYDHLDLATVKGVLRQFPGAKWFVPLGNKSWLLSTGIEAGNIMEMDWWESWEGQFAIPYSASKKEEGESELPTFTVSCVPAQHNSGRSVMDSGNTLWSGWVIERFVKEEQDTKKRRGAIYHSGDTGYRRTARSKEICPVFKEIGERFGGFDVSFIPIWRGGSLGFISAAGVRLLHHHVPSTFHVSPKDAIEIHKDVKSHSTIAVHFGTFVGSEDEALEAVTEL